jgi:hypothetical protein
MNPESIERLLIQCAKEKRSITYSEALAALGLKFTRPKMRELCKLLAIVDQMAHDRGEPALAALVVRASDRLPGDGWWGGRKGFRGDPTGEAARKYVDKQQKVIFSFWAAQSGDPLTTCALAKPV